MFEFVKLVFKGVYLASIIHFHKRKEAKESGEIMRKCQKEVKLGQPPVPRDKRCSVVSFKLAMMCSKNIYLCSHLV